MRIACPYCGSREILEFVVLGDASLQRPDPAADDASQAFHDYVYLRRNPAGESRELWYHASGCRRWLVVIRDTLTHEILAVSYASADGVRS
jgi:sarcosine oxidase subunit delta